MRADIFSLLLSLLTFAAAPGAALAGDESQEPPRQYFIEIAGQRRSLRLDETLSLQGKFTNPTIKISAAPTRHFDFGGIVFDYPAHFTWEAEIEGAGYKNWTLSGNDFKIMYFRLSGQLTPEAFAKSMLKNNPEEKARDFKRTFGKVELHGKSFHITAVGHRMREEALAVPAAPGSALLVLQDSPDPRGQLSTEGKMTLELLQTSLRLGGEE